MLRKLWNALVRGLVVVLPMALTVWLLWWLLVPQPGHGRRQAVTRRGLRALPGTGAWDRTDR